MEAELKEAKKYEKTNVYRNENVMRKKKQGKANYKDKANIRYCSQEINNKI